jgi:cardiolipin synthase
VDLHVDLDLPAGSAEFLSTMAGATGVALIPGNKVTLYQNGAEFYPAMLAAIGAAQTSITMEQYIFSAGKVGREFAQALAQRARAGVRVKLLIDAVGGSAIGRENLRIMHQAGCEVRWFHPIRWYNLHRVNNRNHRKSLIIDGAIAFTGGAGLDDHWLGNAASAVEWRDMMVRLEGPGVVPLQTGFCFNWLETSGEVIAGPQYYPVLDAVGNIEVQAVLSSPKGEMYTASVLYSLAIACARRSISIATPYFVTGPRTLEMLADAARRGVSVKLMTAGTHNDAWWARKNSVRLYGPLLEAGVEIYEYQPTMLHQKTLIVDGIWATLGTANFDHRSFRFNEESMICFCDPDLVDEMQDAFDADLAQCERVRLEPWRGRGLWQRATERFASLLQDQV